MGKNAQIEHEGIVKEVAGDEVRVGFVSQASCSGCHAKGVCNIEQQSGELISVHELNTGRFRIGEKVKIIIKQSLGMKAVLLAYVLPFLVVMVALFVLVGILQNEMVAGVVSLAILAAYYLILSLFRDRIKKEINFTLEKFN